jgi:hypothetical protein
MFVFISLLYLDHLNINAYIVKDGLFATFPFILFIPSFYYFASHSSFRDICESAPVAVRTTLATLREKQNAGLVEAFR